MQEGCKSIFSNFTVETKTNYVKCSVSSVALDFEVYFLRDGLYNKHETAKREFLKSEDFYEEKFYLGLSKYVPPLLAKVGPNLSKFSIERIKSNIYSGETGFVFRGGQVGIQENLSKMSTCKNLIMMR